MSEHRPKNSYKSLNERIEALRKAVTAYKASQKSAQEFSESLKRCITQLETRP